MANAERGQLFRADKLEDMCEKRSEEYRIIKANYETWCVDQQQKLQTETEELENELRQLKENLSDLELGDLRATEELNQLLSRPWMHRDDSPDIEELFAEADRFNSELRRIRANRNRPDEHNQAILSNIEKLQNKLEGLPEAYALTRKEETRRLREQLEGLWQPSSQPDSSIPVSQSTWLPDPSTDMRCLTAEPRKRYRSEADETAHGSIPLCR